MTVTPAQQHPGTSYAFRPSVLGATAAFRLTADAVVWDAGRRSGKVAFRDVTRVRLSFRPVAMQSQRFRIEVWSRNGPKFALVSTSWKSMVEQERLNRPYAAFVRELHRRIAAASATVRFETGIAQPVYWTGLAVTAATVIGLVGLIVRALQAGAWGAALLVLAFLGVFLWNAGNYFRRNRPEVYDPGALPPELLPQG